MPVEPLDDEARPDGLTARRRERILALEVFRAAMSEAPGRLEALHQALEKSQGAKVIRGGWQSDEAGARRSGPSYAACPLNILFADEKREVEATMRASEEALARHGFASADFYRAWDAGLIGVRELLRIVDQTLTAALMGGRDFPGR
jgi:hypothetical protein